MSQLEKLLRKQLLKLWQRIAEPIPHIDFNLFGQHDELYKQVCKQWPTLKHETKINLTLHLIKQARHLHWSSHRRRLVT